ncbi:MAG: LysM peptidoglycan-binding domain-containing protein [Gemmatimonadaceae bacterium]|nr:LysM peptidoglycan-binding domain-containing protein [Gemmatimonadaceae bacterium]
MLPLIPAWCDARRPVLLGTLLAAGLAAGVTPAFAQDAAAPARPASNPGTHTVRQGDTLWDIAKLYLGDAFQWPELYRLNTDVVEDPHKIYPGEILKLPGARPAASGDAGTTALTDNSDNEPVQVSAGRETPTIFATAAVRQQTAPRTAPVAMVDGPAVREGEYASAPFLSRPGGPTGVGRLIGGIDMPETENTASLDTRRFQLRDLVSVIPPQGAAPAVGMRYIAFRLDRAIDGRQIVVPTAVLVVDRVVAGRAPTAQIVRQFETVVAGQRVMAYEAGSRDTLTPVPVSGGRTTRVLDVYGDELVPAVQNFVFLPLGTRDGIRPGDRFSVFRPARRNGSAMIPDTELAELSVIRVTEQGSTAIIIGQVAARFDAGTPARISHRMP